MTDRELLELAAKAAGIEAIWDCSERGMMMSTPDGIDTMSWNPLTDDGDALRLAVKLEFSVYVLRMKIGVAVNGGGYLVWHERSVLGDEADYRRAIVRAAAAIAQSSTPKPT